MLSVYDWIIIAVIIMCLGKCLATVLLTYTHIHFVNTNLYFERD